MNPVSPTFFLCYRREDAGYAAALSAALAARHGQQHVFKDITSMRLAQSWRDQVAMALDRSTHVLVLVGDRWMDGVDVQGMQDGQLDPVVFELSSALQRNVTVVPVLLGGRRMPPTGALPNPLRRFGELSAAHIRTESADDDILRLVQNLPPPRAQSPSRPAPQSPTPARRSGGVAGAVFAGLLVVAVLGVGGWLLINALRGPSTDPLLQLAPDHGPVGTTVTATASGFEAGATVQFLFQARPLADATVGDDGRASASFTVPSGPGGPLVVTALQQRSTRYDEAIFTQTG